MDIRKASNGKGETIMDEYSTWLKFGGSFRCGCCYKMPTFVDIRDLTVCPHCDHIMKWYETDQGIFPIKNQGEGENDGNQET